MCFFLNAPSAYLNDIAVSGCIFLSFFHGTVILLGRQSVQAHGNARLTGVGAGEQRQIILAGGHVLYGGRRQRVDQLDAVVDLF